MLSLKIHEEKEGQRKIEKGWKKRTVWKKKNPKKKKNYWSGDWKQDIVSEEWHKERVKDKRKWNKMILIRRQKIKRIEGKGKR